MSLDLAEGVAVFVVVVVLVLVGRVGRRGGDWLAGGLLPMAEEMRVRRLRAFRRGGTACYVAAGVMLLVLLLGALPGS